MTQEHWKATYEFTLPDGRELHVGDSFNLTGEKGKRYRFIKHVSNPDNGSEWIDCFGGSSGRQQSRSIVPERVNKVFPKKPKAD